MVCGLKLLLEDSNKEENRDGDSTTFPSIHHRDILNDGPRIRLGHGLGRNGLCDSNLSTTLLPGKVTSIFGCLRLAKPV